MVYTGCWEGIAIIGGGILASLLIVAFSRRLFPADVLRDGHHATGNLLAIVGTLYAVLLGLLVVDAMVRFERAMDGVQAESNSLADIYLLAERLPAVQRAAVVQRHVAAMELREVNPAAMVYTELDRLPIRPKWVEDRVILWPYFWP
jgi:hypothetical protein